MNTRPPTTPAEQQPDLRALSGLLWTLGGALLALGVALLDSAPLGILTLGVWCLATAWRMGVRG